jgi:hypothetical protein
MAPSDEPGGDYVKVAEVAIDSVQPGRTGFVLTGRGSDRADYRLEMDLEMPVDQRTRAVLAEILAQSDWKIQRRATHPFQPRRLHDHRKAVQERVSESPSNST